MHLLKNSVTLCMLIAAPVFANPIGGQVAAGTAHIQYGSTTVITQTTNRAVINWKDFSVGANETTRFNTIGPNAVTLNRVVGGNPSAIMGNLSSNGQIFLVNPNGIIFGKTARVDVAGLVASTANITNSDFMNGNYHFSNAPAGSYVINKGTITVRKAGLAALVAPNVRNSGTIQANLGKVALASGTAFTLDLYGDNLIAFDASSIVNAGYVENLGRIEANGGSVMLSVASAENMIENVINTSGYISAQSVGTKNGKILLQGYNNSAIQISGTLDASGDGSGETGGTIHIFSSKIDLLTGNLLKASGDMGGGFIETSGQTLNLSAAQVNASSPHGLAGTWFIDPPANLTVDDIAAASYSSILGGGTNVILNFDNIFFTNSLTPISWFTDASFTAYANDTIDFNTGTGIALDNQGNGNITLYADHNNDGTGSVTFTSGPFNTVNSVGNGVINIFYNPTSYATPDVFSQVWGSYTAYMLVHNATDLQNISTNLDGDYAQGGNITGSGGTFTPIGDSATPFTGVFTGNGFSISNLNIVGTTDVGLFGYAQFADIYNVTLLDSTVTGTTNVGSIIGNVQAPTYLYGFYSNATVNGVDQVGGIIGLMGPDGPPSDPTPATSLYNAFFSGTVNGTTNVGGIVGENMGHIFTSLSVGTLNGGTNVGGVAGNNSGSITNSYSSLSTFAGNAVGTGSSSGALAVLSSSLTSLPSGFDSSIWQANGSNYYISLISCGSSCIIPIVSGGGSISNLEKQYVTTNSILNNNVPKTIPVVRYYIEGSLMYTVPLSTGDGIYVITVTPETDTKGTIETAIDTLKSAYGCATQQ